MPPLVRRKPLMERIRAFLNPYDWALWLSEEIYGNDWDDSLKDWTWIIGVVVNLIFMIARGNSGGSKYEENDDVFGDYTARMGSGWLRWLCSFVVHLLSFISFVNAFFTFHSKRHYRLFETPVEMTPTTPSARRVRVDSSPLSSSPLRFLSNIYAATSAQSRAHPDPARDVWEVSVWDPKPTFLRLFCLFSPGHVLVYWLFLPIAPLDPRPSVTVVTAIVLGALMTVQLSFMQTSYSQQIKDSALIHREVLHEYDTKFVHPNLNKPVRDVGIQTGDIDSGKKPAAREVDTYTPKTIINRGFRTNPNPVYASQYDPDNQLQQQDERQARAAANTAGMSNPFYTNTPKRVANSYTSTATAMHNSPAAGAARRTTGGTPLRQPQFRPTTDASAGGDGGSLGVFAHAASPLRKPAGANFLRADDVDLRPRSPEKRGGSPLKRISTPADYSGSGGTERQRRSYRDSGRY
ncbi:uncharacterized protein K452DRAFT_316365 [Aplosporella prunicola CBS 121167]|uniref:Nuclear rim protein 1 n=1 Tax=Aplosporella prunicola CBS 121167 TaxID=1176127 RepID=A0A6A6BPY7_9PEZI|nr:uncharacterized protein K452DRAFT_316365 [Aplosporella prunicola CBS 121167]KAF2145294.1 hypothetical protein K452DRAFT_316365 [Aplosporella prunicola CBS 121167]